MKMAIGFNWGDLTLQTYRTTTVSSQSVIIRFIIPIVFNKLIRVGCMYLSNATCVRQVHTLHSN